MIFDHRHYVPCIRWKQGEYRAMLHLSSSSREIITPLIEVPEIGFDFETNTNMKSVDEHLSPFAKRVRSNLQMQPCFVDLNLIDTSKPMADGRHPVNFVFDELRAQRCLATPVIGINRGRQYQQAVERVVSKDKRGLCLRISLEDASKTNIKAPVDALLEKNGLGVSECDLVIDLGAPNFKPIEGFAKLIEVIVQKLPYLSKWRTFTIIGTSFPQSMAEVSQGLTTIQRFEWLLYKNLINRLNKVRVRLPTFGDYGINHPDVQPMDMRILKPSATIRYTIDDAWLIVKGPNVREHGYSQYRYHCKAVIASSCFLGSGFSKGDEYIASCASGTAKTGNLTTWRMVGTNHHLEKVARDISSFYDS